MGYLGFTGAVFLKRGTKVSPLTAMIPLGTAFCIFILFPCLHIVLPDGILGYRELLLVGDNGVRVCTLEYI